MGCTHAPDGCLCASWIKARLIAGNVVSIGVLEYQQGSVGDNVRAGTGAVVPQTSCVSAHPSLRSNTTTR